MANTAIEQGRLRAQAQPTRKLLVDDGAATGKTLYDGRTEISQAHEVGRGRRVLVPRSTAELSLAAQTVRAVRKLRG
jgi:hypothetical protein